ncbi:MAG: 1,4-dihydroxy-2-naphthoate octaprenyltransferase, partial [Bacteroidales bacterium]|nr:1,4-dihydroxy-2-naphthoate octaprenyltransferase [Bacteroidales bacterium]
MACGLVIDALLIINNYRDRDNDREDEKKTLVVEIGAEATEWLYLSLGIVAVLAGIIFWMNGHILAFVLPIFY